MNMPRRLPLGNQDFEKLRNFGALYVDKTLYIEKLVTTGNVFFLSRPHRFGKSLFLSTLKAYFEGKKELFEGLYIDQVETELARQQKREPWEARPVLYFDLNAKNYKNSDTLTNSLSAQLLDFEQLYDVERTENEPENRFIKLIKTLYRKTGKRVVILVDEYDKPLLETIENEELNQANRSMLRAFYEVIK